MRNANRCLISTLTSALILLTCTGTSRADLSFSGSSGSLSATALFSLSGTTLTVTLTNTSSADVLVPTDVLHAVLFNTTAGSLTPVSASLNGSTVFYAPLVNNVGEGWVYADGISAQGKNSGISSAGFGVFGNTNFFFNPGVSPLDGTNYGILSAGDNSGTGNSGVTGGGPLIKNSIQFTLTAAAGFSLSQLGDSVVFQYGTSLDGPHFTGSPVPEPSTMALAGLGALGFIGYGLRRRLKK